VEVDIDEDTSNRARETNLKNADAFYLLRSIEKVACKVNVEITSPKFPSFRVSSFRLALEELG
jgi:hypothetical protein